jgi:hypothetical protein
MGRRPAWALSASIFLLAGCGGSSPERFDPGRWLTANTAGKTVTLTLRAEGGRTGLGGINGYRRGQVLVEIPAGWQVTVRCQDTSSTPQIVRSHRQQPLRGPGVPRGGDAAPRGGLRAGGSATFSFVASRPCAYRIACVVDDEEIGNGMWEGLQIGGTRQPVAILVRRSP